MSSGFGFTPDAAWPVVARHPTFTVYEIGEAVLLIWPQQGCTDTEDSATASVQAQHEHWRAKGHAGGAVVLMDMVHEQTLAARKIYGLLPDPTLITSFALVGGTAFGRAVSSVFLGIQRPEVPTRAFRDLEPAVAWVREQSLV